MRPSRNRALLDKAIDAALAAIEVYNKPAFRYREESFAILMLNAWELLLKAEILRRNANRMRSVEVWERRRTKSGSASRRSQPKLNRAGNRMTIGLAKAIDVARQYQPDGLDEPGAENLRLLMEIRDNAVHLRNVGRGLKLKVQEIGTASLRNFAHAAQVWFQRDLTDYHLWLMPLAFDAPSGVVEAVGAKERNASAGRVLKHLTAQAAAFPFDPARPFNVAIQIQLQFVRRTADGAIPMVFSTDPSAVPVKITEEDAWRPFSLRYDELRGELHARYPDFKENRQFHHLRQRLERDPTLCRERRLDPERPSSGRKKFYSPNILAEFDRTYRGT